MSLINEALKKAQRRQQDGADADGAPAGSPIRKRSQPKSARSMLLLAAGAVVLVVLSMVLTALWLTAPSPSAVVATTAPGVAPMPAPAQMADAPTLVVPALLKSTPAEAAGPVATTMPPAATPEPVAPSAGQGAGTGAATITPLLAALQPEQPAQAEAPPAPPPVAKPDERIHQFVEALRVTGIRSSGTDGKVLMNGRVYRVNDVVDRTLEVRLTAVSAESLTFTDSNGVTYEKRF